MARALTNQERQAYRRLANIRNTPGQRLTTRQRQRLRELEAKRTEGGGKSLLNKPFKDGTGSGGNTGSTGNINTRDFGDVDLRDSLRLLDPEDRRSIRSGVNLGEWIGRKVGLDGEDPLGRLDTTRTAEIADLLQRFQDFADSAGIRSQDAKNTLSRFETLADNAGIRSQEMKDIIARRQAGLEGLTGKELEGLREQGFQSIDRNFNTDQRALAAAQARSGVRGGAAGAQFRNLLRDRIQGTRDLERDIFLANVEERNKRLLALEQLIGGLEKTEFDQKQRANIDLGNFLGGLENREFIQKSTALGQLGNARQAQQNFDRAGEIFNLSQLANEIAARTGLITGGIAATTGIQAGNEANALQEAAIAAQERAAEQAFTLGQENISLGQEGLALQREMFNNLLNSQNQTPAASGSVDTGNYDLV